MTRSENSGMALTEFHSNALKEPRARKTLAMVDSNRVVMKTVGTLSGGREVPLPTGRRGWGRRGLTVRGRSDVIVARWRSSGRFGRGMDFLTEVVVAVCHIPFVYGAACAIRASTRAFERF